MHQPTASPQGRPASGSDQLPAGMAALVAHAIGPSGGIAAVVDVSWPRPASNVWEVTDARDGRWYAKLHPTAKFHRREVAAYRTWVPVLGGDAPELVACDDALPAVVVTAVAGVPVKRQRLGPRDVRVHALAGALVRRIHEAMPDSALRAPAVSAASADKHLARTHLTGREWDRVRGVLADAAAVLLPVVATHGDFQPRNWLWAPEQGRLRVIDFERAEPAAAVRDFRLLPHGPWLGRPDLYEAFLGGYGRALSADEEAALAGWVVLDALDAAWWGREHGDAEVEARGLAGLARLRDGP